MYSLGECCASCSSMIHDPPSIYLLSFFPWSFLNHSLKMGGPLMSTWFFSNLTYPQISSPFLFFAFSFVSIQDLSFFTSVTSLFCLIWTRHPRGSCFFSFPSFLFFVSLGFVTCCSCVHAPLFFCPLACFPFFWCVHAPLFFCPYLFLMIADYRLIVDDLIAWLVDDGD